jgi:hypothetical protein
MRASRQEHQLWLLSFGIAVVITLALLVVIGLLILQSQLSPRVAAVMRAPEEQVVIIMAEPEPPPVPTPLAEPEKSRPSFARTSPDQASAPPEKADFIGERDTVATSDAVPVAGAPAMPSQAGREPRRPGEIETTESKVQDGTLEHDQLAQKPTPPTPPTPPTMAATTPPEEVRKTPAQEAAPASDAPKPTPEKSRDSPETMASADTPILPGDQLTERPVAEEQAPKPQIASKPPSTMPEKTETAPPELPKPTPKPNANDPGFRGNQTKTRLSGSISRKGRSALNVANTAMGRYHSALSRAVEAEWHKNCLRYRDFITPGILTVRFVIAPDGTVRTISVVEMVDAGEVQKGFTLSSIRQAKIPPIPADLKAEIDDEPIELIYNFYF